MRISPESVQLALRGCAFLVGCYRKALGNAASALQQLCLNAQGRATSHAEDRVPGSKYSPKTAREENLF